MIDRWKWPSLAAREGAWKSARLEGAGFRPGPAPGFLCALALGVAVASAACAESRGLRANFGDGWKAEGPGSSRRDEGAKILARLAGAAENAALPAAVGVTGRGLRGHVFGTSPTWHYSGPVDVLPSLSGDVVAFSGKGSVTVLDVRDGKLRFSVPTFGRRLEAMSTDGQHFLLLVVDSDDARPDQLLLTNASGQILAAATTERRVGAPLAYSGLGFVPWNRQVVSVFDLATGDPLGRLLVRDSIHQVTAIDGNIWVLGRGAVRLDADILDSVGEGSARLPIPELPGEPEWPVDASQPRLAKGQPVSIWASPSTKTASRFVANTFVYGYYDVLVGFSAKTGRPTWTNHATRSLVGGAAGPQGVTLCMEDGSLLHARYSDGLTKPVGSLDARLKACVVTPVRDQVLGSPRGSFPVQVRETIRGTGPEMAAVQEFLLARLAEDQSSRVTQVLLAIAQDPLSSAVLSARAGELIASRRSGEAAMIRALEVGVEIAEGPSSDPPAHASETPAGEVDPPPAADAELSFELPPAGQRPPPVTALAEALTAMRSPRAAQALAPYLELPGILGRRSLAIMRALSVLGTESEIPQVLDFFSTFKNSSGDEAFMEALILAAKFLLERGDEEVQSRVVRSRDDVLTHPDLAQALTQLTADSSRTPPPEAAASPARGRGSAAEERPARAGETKK